MRFTLKFDQNHHHCRCQKCLNFRGEARAYYLQFSNAFFTSRQRKPFFSCLTRSSGPWILFNFCSKTTEPENTPLNPSILLVASFQSLYHQGLTNPSPQSGVSYLAQKKMEPPSHSCVYETLRRKFPICNFLKTPGPFYWHQPNPTHKYHTTPEIQHRPNKNEVWNTKTTSPNLKKLIGPWRRMFFVLPLGA